jgi:hypothetical protein
MKLRKVYQGVIPEHKILNQFSESQSDTYSCETINTMISEIDLSNAVFEETDPTVPQHVKNITEEEIAKWNASGSGTLTEEVDPTVPEHVKNITVEDITRWDAGGEGGSKPEIAIQDDKPESDDIVFWIDPTEEPEGFNNEINFESEYLTVTRSSYINSATEDVLIPYDKIVEDASNGKLMLGSQGIVIGPGVTMVRVVAQVGIQNQSSGYDQKRLSLYVNGVKTQVSYAMSYTKQYAVGVVTIDRILKVKEGDLLSLYAGHAAVASSVLKDEFNIFTVEVLNGRKAYAQESHRYDHYYSYQEQLIGKWVDGKNLYEKTIYVENLDLTTEGYQYIPHYIENINQVIDFKYREQCTPIVYGEDEFGDFSNETYRHVLRSWAFNKKYIRLHNQAWENIQNWYFTIQYTKKDEEGLD